MEMYERLVEFRKRRGLTQDELAKEVGVSRQTVSKWERGLIAPSGASLIALGRVYGISVDELVNEALSPEERAAVAVAEKPEEAPPRKKPLPLKIMGAAVAAAFVLLVATASVITIVSAIVKKPEEPELSKDGFPIIDLEDMNVEDIDLSEVEDMSDGTKVIESADGTHTIIFDITLGPNEN